MTNFDYLEPSEPIPPEGLIDYCDGMVVIWDGDGRVLAAVNPNSLGDPDSFEVIAKTIGVTTGGAHAIYKRALRKIQKKIMKNPELAREWFTYLKSAKPNLQSPKIPEETELGEE